MLLIWLSKFFCWDLCSHLKRVLRLWRVKQTFVHTFCLSWDRGRLWMERNWVDLYEISQLDLAPYSPLLLVLSIPGTLSKFTSSRFFFFFFYCGSHSSLPWLLCFLIPIITTLHRETKIILRLSVVFTKTHLHGSFSPSPMTVCIQDFSISWIGTS